MWVLIPSLFSSVLAQLLVELWNKSYDEIHLTKKKKEKTKEKTHKSDLIFLLFQFPGTIHIAAVGRIMLAGLVGKAAECRRWKYLEWLYLNLGQYLYCQM